MDKISMTSFGILPARKYTEVVIGETTISVANRIAYEDVLNMIQWAINHIMDDRPFISGPVRRIVTDIALIKSYTNLDLSRADLVDFTAADLYEWYDILTAFNAIELIRAAIDPTQLAFYEETLNETMQSLVAYHNSAVGTLDRIQAAQANASESATNIFEMLDNPEELDKVKRMMELMDIHIPDISPTNSPAAAPTVAEE